MRVALYIGLIAALSAASARAQPGAAVTAERAREAAQRRDAEARFGQAIREMNLCRARAVTDLQASRDAADIVARAVMAECSEELAALVTTSELEIIATGGSAPTNEDQDAERVRRTEESMALVEIVKARAGAASPPRTAQRRRP